VKQTSLVMGKHSWAGHASSTSSDLATMPPPSPGKPDGRRLRAVQDVADTARKKHV